MLPKSQPHTIPQLQEHCQDKSLFGRDVTFSGISGKKKKILADGFKLKGTLTQISLLNHSARFIEDLLLTDDTEMTRDSGSLHSPLKFQHNAST